MIFLRFIAVLCGALAISTHMAMAAPREIRVTSQLPPDSALHQSIAMFKVEVEKNAQGALAIKIFPSGQLYKPEEVRDAVSSGAIEMGAVLLTEYVEQIPASDIFSLPFMFSTEPLRRVATVPTSPIRAPIDRTILEKSRTHVLWWFPSGTTIVVSKGTPVLTPANIAAKKVRVSGSSLAEMVRLCGGTPLEAGGTEQYELYKSGKVDVGMTSMSIIAARKLWEVMDTITITNHIQSEFVLAMNEDVWQSLPPEHQQILQRAARSSEQFFRVRAEELAKEGLELARQKGMKIAEVTDAQVKEWKECATPMLASFLSKAGPLGQKVLDGYRKVLVESYKLPPQR